MRRAFQLSIYATLLLTTSNNELLAQHNGSFVDIQPLAGLEHPSAWEYISDMSDDGLRIAMSSTRQNSSNFRDAGFDFYQATRNSISEPFEEPERIDALSRSGIEDGHQTFSSDGLATFFASEPPTDGKPGIWTATRETLENDWSEPEFLDIDLNFAFGPRLSNDDLTLYLHGAITSSGTDVFMMQRASLSEPFGDPVPVSEINTSNMFELQPVFSNDELTMFYSSGLPGNLHINVATRPSKDEPFGAPVGLDDFGLGSEVNASFANSWVPIISADWPADGSKIYFSGNDNLQGDWNIYEATWNVYTDGDANLDNEVNFADFLILSDNFGQDGTWREGDFDGNGEVDFPDFLIVSENFGAVTNEAAAAVPEPTGLSLALFGLVGLIGLRKRR